MAPPKAGGPAKAGHYDGRRGGVRQRSAYAVTGAALPEIAHNAVKEVKRV